MDNQEQIIDICGIDVLKHDALPLLEWLRDPRGKFFWQWLSLQSKTHHDLSSKPPSQIMELVTSQRNLAAENAFDQVFNYPILVKDAVSEHTSSRIFRNVGTETNRRGSAVRPRFHESQRNNGRASGSTGIRLIPPGCYQLPSTSILVIELVVVPHFPAFDLVLSFVSPNCSMTFLENKRSSSSEAFLFIELAL